MVLTEVFVGKFFYTNVIPDGSEMIVFGYRDGERFIERIPFRPSFYRKTEDPFSECVGLDGARLEKQTMSLYDFRKFSYENQTNPDIYGNIGSVYQFIQEGWNSESGTDFYDLKNIRILYLDIEVEVTKGFPDVNMAQNEVTAITMKDSKTGIFYVLGMGDFDAEHTNKIQSIPASKIRYKKCADERELLQTFIVAVDKLSPDLISGWNVEFFDIPYLSNRILVVLGPNGVQSLALNRRLNRKELRQNDKVFIYHSWLIPVLDYLALYQKFSFETQESYSLDYISGVELGERKLEKHSDLMNLMRDDHQKFIEYNIWDTELVAKIEDKKRLIQLALTISYMTLTLYEDVFSPVKLWDVLIYNRLKKKNVEITPHTNNYRQSYPGAYVREVTPGKYKWIVFFDLNSLYPNLIIGFNLSKETMVDTPSEIMEYIKEKITPNTDLTSVFSGDYEDIIDHFIAGELPTDLLKKHNVTMTANLQCWKTDTPGTMGEIMNQIYQDRIIQKGLLKQARKDNRPEDEIRAIDLIQNALKVLMNSGYGAFGNEHFRYFDIRVASGITLNGQLVIRFLQTHLAKYLGDTLDVVYGDTDSIAVSLDKFVKREGLVDTDPSTIDKVEEYAKNVVQTAIDKLLGVFSTYTNMYLPTMEMKMEIVGDAGIWLAKKKYFVRKWIDDGFRLEKPKLKFTGLELVRSSTPMIVREKMRDLVPLFLDLSETEMVQMVRDYKSDFLSRSVEDVSFPRSVSNLEKYSLRNDDLYMKGTPIHVRGSILHNHLLKKFKVKHIDKIYSGDKIKFVYLTMPNPIGENVIAFKNFLPEEFGLHRYVDYSLQFEKNVVKPLTLLSLACGWDLAEMLHCPRESMADLF